LKEGNAKSPQVLDFASEYVIKKVQGKKVGLKCNWAHHLIFCAYNMNLLGDNICIMKESTEIGVQLNAEKLGMWRIELRYKMTESCFQNAAFLKYVFGNDSKKSKFGSEIY
jgi:hypothetical protein